MENNQIPANNDMQVSDSELRSIRSYIEQKDTAVLTVMFTDIQGFTDATELHGEEYSTRLRQHHDRIMREVIEEERIGLIIKFIGDAVMAVFAEPSAAVERALLVQQRMREFNASQQEFEPLNVRIGLHMGQVAIGADVQPDVFGRHVNRAARIEALADGGHIYLSYPVFDSAKGWLSARKDLIWQFHGDYLLKGIGEPVAIYEVIASAAGPAKSPSKGTKVRRFPKLIASIALLLLGASLAAGIFWYQQTEVWLQKPYPDALVLDQHQPLVLSGMQQDDARRSMTEIAPGKHLLHFPVTASDRYYAEIEVVRGSNQLKPKFIELRLPELFYRAEPVATEALVQGIEDHRNGRYDYLLYDNNGEKLAYKSEVVLMVHRSIAEENGVSVFRAKIDGSVTVNGKTVVLGPIERSLAVDAPGTGYTDWQPLYEDSLHQYVYRYLLSNTFQGNQRNVQVEISGRFKPELP